jgi:hypothetical protein
MKDIDWFNGLCEENQAKFLEGVHERTRLCSSKCPCWSFEYDRLRNIKKEYERAMGGSHA